MSRGADWSRAPWTRQELFNIGTREAVHMMIHFPQTSYQDPDSGRVTQHTGEQHARQLLTTMFRDSTLTEQCMAAGRNWIAANPGQTPSAHSQGKQPQEAAAAPEQLEVAEDETDPFEETERGDDRE